MDRHMRQLVDGMATARADDHARRPEFWARLAEAQRPSVVVICCSDSRAAPEHITRADPGTLFVERTVAGLVPTPPGSFERGWLRLYGALTRGLGLRNLSGAWYGPWAAIEFPLVQLEVPNIVVLGHSGCGGVALAMQPRGARPDLPDTDAWVDMVRPTVHRAVRAMDRDSAEARLAAEHAVVLWSRRNLLRHAGIDRHVRQGKTSVHAGHFDIASGRVSFWDEATSRFAPAISVALAPDQLAPACCAGSGHSANGGGSPCCSAA
jgi:carbonic anhydrase